MGWSGFSASGGIAFDCSWIVFLTVHHAGQLNVQRQYSCDALTVFMHFLTTQQTLSKGMRSNLEGSQPQLQAHACEKPNTLITTAYADAQSIP